MARVLIVDDESQIRDALGHLLQGMGHECGVGFDEHRVVQELIDDQQYYPVLLYPGTGARDLATKLMNKTG